MPSDDLITLAERCEAAEVSEQRVLLLEAYELLVTDMQWDVGTASSFLRKVDAEAYVDAAMMLVPENMPMWAVTSRNSATVGNKDNPLSWRFAANPALALTAACLRAIGGEDD